MTYAILSQRNAADINRDTSRRSIVQVHPVPAWHEVQLRPCAGERHLADVVLVLALPVLLLLPLQRPGLWLQDEYAVVLCRRFRNLWWMRSMAGWPPRTEWLAG